MTLCTRARVRCVRVRYVRVCVCSSVPGPITSHAPDINTRVVDIISPPPPPQVQYPGLAGSVAADLCVMSALARAAGALFPTIRLHWLYEELAAKLEVELDFRWVGRGERGVVNTSPNSTKTNENERGWGGVGERLVRERGWGVPTLSPN